MKFHLILLDRHGSLHPGRRCRSLRITLFALVCLGTSGALPLRVPLLATVSAAPLSAQASPYVLISDPGYRDLDLLVAHRLVEQLTLSHRPYSRMTFARATQEARGRLDELTAGTGGTNQQSRQPPVRVLEALGRLESRFAEEQTLLNCRSSRGAEEESCAQPSARLEMRSIKAVLTGADSPARDARAPQPGQVNDAVLNPLLQRNGGRELHDGLTWAAEAEIDLYLHPNLAGQAGPRVRLSSNRPDGVDAAGASLTTGYLRTLWGKAFFDVGRTQTLSGMTMGLSPVLSSNPRALTMIRVGNERDGRLPWILGKLGPANFRFALGSLGDNRANPGSILTVIEASIRPHPNLELGGSILSEQGGEGAPEADFWDRVVDTFGFILYRRPFQFLSDEGDFSNKLIGINGRLKLPSLPVSVFFDFTTEDDHNFFSAGNQGYWINAAWVWGAEARGVGPQGRFDVKLAAMHNGPITASHSSLPSGLTLDGRTLGSPLGPEGSGVDLKIDWVGPHQMFALAGAFERYSGDDFVVRPRSLGGGRVLGTDNPDELRARVTLEWTREAHESGVFTALRVGGERVTRFDYTDEDRTNFLGQLRVGYRW